MGKKHSRPGKVEVADDAGLGALAAAFAARGITPRSPPASPEVGAEAPVAPAEVPAAPVGAALAGQGKLTVRMTRKGRGGRTVTLVQGLSLPEDELAALAKRLRRALGAGVSVDDGELVAQGDLRPRLRELLLAEGARRVVVG